MVLLYWRIESLAFGAVEIRGLNESGGVACFFLWYYYFVYTHLW